MPVVQKRNPITLFCFIIMVLFITMITMHPIMLGISLMSGILLLLTLAGVRKTLKTIACILPLVLICGVINPLFSKKGATILIQIDDFVVTLEALLNGVAVGIMFAAIICWFSSLNILMTSDKIVYLFSKYTPKIGTILMISLGLFPKYVRQYKKIDTNLMALGLYENAGYIKKIKLKIHILSTLVTWSIESSLTLSNSMSARGYELHGKRVYSRYSFSAIDVILISFSLAVGISILTLFAMGYCSYYFYPKLKPITIDLQSLIFLFAGVLMNLYTIIILGERAKWQLSIAKI